MNFNSNILSKRLEFTRKVITRFPPEPNGHLHLGHLKGIYINFMYAKENNGICYLRLDDTNPLTEKMEYVESIIEDINWLGFKPYKITYTSDYFDILLEYAYKLINNNLAYVCSLKENELNRRDGYESPDRNNTVEHNIELFDKMVNGVYDEGEYTLRLRIDMNSNNPNMRDPVIYRIIKAPHYKTLNRYNVYPTYDYSHCIVDSIENISHSMCSSEFKTKNECYQWICNKLDIYCPRQIEFSRLQIKDAMLSKRKIKKLIDDKVVDSWSSPNLLTIKGMKAKGYTAESLTNFVKSCGIQFDASDTFSTIDVLNGCLKKELNVSAIRRMAVFDPIKVVIINCDNNSNQSIYLKNYPQSIDSTVRNVVIDNIVYIDRADFSLNPNKNYKRLTPNNIVMLKYAFAIKYVNHDVDETDSNIVKTIYVNRLDLGTKFVGVISWIPTLDNILEVNEFMNISNSIDINNLVNKSIIYTESSDLLKTNTHIQFERYGYYYLDLTNKLIKLFDF